MIRGWTSMNREQRVTKSAEARQSYKNYTRNIDQAYGVLGSYDYFQELKASVLLNTMKQLTPKGESLKIRDLGAGTGTLLSALPAVHFRVGVEPETELISQMPAGQGPCVVNASGLALPFEDACFDLVYMACVLHHVQNKELAPMLKECARIIRSGGMLAIFEHNAYNLPVVVFLKAFVKIDRDAHFLTARLVARLVRQAELRPLRPIYMCFFPRFLRIFLWLEKYMFWLPLGGQYCLISRKATGNGSEAAH